MSTPSTPLKLVVETAEGFALDTDALLELAKNCEGIGGRTVAVVSISGSEREGKSFMMSCTLQGLPGGNEQEWTRESQVKLRGFPSQNGIERHTSGIVVWPKPIPISDEVAVVLMDTQGTGGGNPTKDSIIIAFASLISSVQIYNTKSNVEATKMETLMASLDFASTALRTSTFERLVVLVRDWTLTSRFGREPGREVLTGYLEKYPALQARLTPAFAQALECFLMPSPGEAATSENFDGSINQLSPQFIVYLKEFISVLRQWITPKVLPGGLIKHMEEVFYATMAQGRERPRRSIWETYEFNRAAEQSRQIVSEFKSTYERRVKGADKAIADDISNDKFGSVGQLLDCFSDFEKLKNDEIETFQKHCRLQDKLLEERIKCLDKDLKDAMACIELALLKDLIVSTSTNLAKHFKDSVNALVGERFYSAALTFDEILAKHTEEVLGRVFRALDSDGVNAEISKLVRSKLRAISKAYSADFKCVRAKEQKCYGVAAGAIALACGAIGGVVYFNAIAIEAAKAAAAAESANLVADGLAAGVLCAALAVDVEVAGCGIAIGGNKIYNAFFATGNGKLLPVVGILCILLGEYVSAAGNLEDIKL